MRDRDSERRALPYFVLFAITLSTATPAAIALQQSFQVTWDLAPPALWAMRGALAVIWIVLSSIAVVAWNQVMVELDPPKEIGPRQLGRLGVGAVVLMLAFMPLAFVANRYVSVFIAAWIFCAFLVWIYRDVVTQVDT